MYPNPLEMPVEINRKSSRQNAFPSARYFQIHFDYLHELMQEMKKQLEASNQKITLLQQQINEFMPTDSESSTNKH
ncbi:MAG: hypothetical protein ABL903_03510 [Methylococcales bacterium]